MPDREVSPWAVLHDIRSGMDESSLMEKYRLTFQGVQHLYSELVSSGLLEEINGQLLVPSRRRIDGQEIVHQIRSGLSEIQLMENYRLSSRGLQRLFSKLIASNLIDERELYRFSFFSADSVTVKAPRKLQRSLPLFEVEVLDERQPTLKGRLRDISERGVAVTGIPSAVDEVRRLVLVPNKDFEIEPVSIEVRCCWLTKHDDTGLCEAGFEISRISGKELEALKTLIDSLTLIFS